MYTVIPREQMTKNIYFLNPIPHGKFLKNNNIMNKLFMLSEHLFKKFDISISNSQIDIKVNKLRFLIINFRIHYL